MTELKSVSATGFPDVNTNGQNRFCKTSQDTNSTTVRRNKVLARGDRLDLGNGACRKMWIIQSGMAAICTGLADGRRQIIGLETPGDIVCGMAAANGSDSWIEALCDTEVSELDISSIGNPLANRTPDPEQIGLLVELFSLIHRRLEICSAHLVTLGRLDSTERVILFVLDMTRRIGRACGKSMMVDLPLTREDIADYLGLNAETISRIFTRLKKSSLVQFPSRTCFAVADTNALERRLPVDLVTSASSIQIDSFLSAIAEQQPAQNGACQ